jgi:hypothetical protein
MRRVLLNKKGAVMWWAGAACKRDGPSKTAGVQLHRCT